MQVNATVKEQLADLTRAGANKGRKWEKKLAQFAREANESQPGPLDNPKGKLSHMPSRLRHIRHYQLGRHRIFLAGSHQTCSYQGYLIKEFKRAGVDTEGSQSFQQKLLSALSNPATDYLSPEGLPVPLVTQTDPS